MTASAPFGIMTSGASTAALLALQPALERVADAPVALLSRSIGIGATYIPTRLRRGEVADLVIVADQVLAACIAEGLVIAGSETVLVRSRIGIAVRAGAPPPEVDTPEALVRTLLAAESIAYSASVSGDYLATVLWPRMGIAEAVLAKARRVGDEHIGAVVARGEAQIGFEQISELLPIPGIDHVTPLPPEAQKETLFSGGVGARTPDPVRAATVLAFLRSAEAGRAFAASGLAPVSA